MKQATITAAFLFFLSGNTYCQDIIVTSTDKVTGKTIAGIKSLLTISKDSTSGFSIYFYKEHEQYKGMHPLRISIKALGAGSCIELPLS